MNASELYKAGKLQEAIDAQIKVVKESPADQAKRVFLFELLAFAGELERAKKQIEAVSYGEMELDAAAAAYRKVLDAEENRRRLLRDGLKPNFLADPPEHVRLRLEAVNRLREQKPGEAAETLAAAAGVTPAVRGKLNGQAFETLRDCDDLFAGVLEVVAHGTYYWVPLEQVVRIVIKPPRFPRDLIWLPGRLETLTGGAGDVLLPVLYPGTHEHPDNKVKLGRQTDWKGPEGGPMQGLGARVFLVDSLDEAVPLLEWRELALQD
jgi:type VI secretion system protein ImpE